MLRRDPHSPSSFQLEFLFNTLKLVYCKASIAYPQMWGWSKFTKSFGVVISGPLLMTTQNFSGSAQVSCKGHSVKPNCFGRYEACTPPCLTLRNNPGSGMLILPFCTAGTCSAFAVGKLTNETFSFCRSYKPVFCVTHNIMLELLTLTYASLICITNRSGICQSVPLITQTVPHQQHTTATCLIVNRLCCLLARKESLLKVRIGVLLDTSFAELIII